MQLLFLKADPPTSESKQAAGQRTRIAYMSGTVGALCLSLLLIAACYLSGWNPGLPLLDLHTHNLRVSVLQSILILLICWLSTLAGSLLQRRRPSSLTASRQATVHTIQHLLLPSGALFLALAAVVLVSNIVRGHTPPAPLLAFLPLPPLLRFRPEIFTISWIALHLRGKHPPTGATLVDFFPAPDDQEFSGGDEQPPDPNR